MKFSSGSYMVTGLALAASLCACGSGSKGAATSSDGATSVFASYLDGIDNGFVKLRGRKFGDSAAATKYLATTPLPHTNACAITLVKQTGDSVATCFFVSAAQPQADAAYAAAKRDAAAGAPGLTGADEAPSNGNIAEYFSKDATRAIYISEARQDDGKYTVVTSFGTPAALK
jgi:hypothetical protein